MGFFNFCLLVFVEADAERECDGQEDIESVNWGSVDEVEYVPFLDSEMSGGSDGNVVPTVACFGWCYFLLSFRAMSVDVAILFTS